jgi:hypothetical protein
VEVKFTRNWYCGACRNTSRLEFGGFDDLARHSHCPNLLQLPQSFHTFCPLTPTFDRTYLDQQTDQSIIMQGLMSGDRIGLTDGATNRYLRINRPVRGFHSINVSDVDFRSQQSKGLHSRLEEILVFVIEKDGGSFYKRLTVRSLYKYVMTAIKQTNVYPQDGSSKRNMGSKRPRGGSVDDQSGRALLDQLALARAVVHAPPGGLHARSTSDASALGVGGMTNPTNVNDTNAATTNVTYRERLGSYLNFRDVRKVVTPFSASNEPEIIVRRHVCLINFDPLRAIILRDRLLIVVPDGADSILVELEKRVRGKETFDFSDDSNTSKVNDDMTLSNKKSKRDENTNSNTDESSGADNGSNDDDHDNGDHHDGDDDHPFEALFDEWEELDKADWVDLPFELQCLDAVLSASSDILGDDVLDLQVAADNMIVEMLEPRSDVGDHAQEILRQMKNSTRELISRVAGFNRAIDSTLEDYEDMALMNLGRLITHPARFIQPVPQSVLDEESDEPELILEAHLQRGHTALNALNLIEYQVQSIEDFAERKMDTIRNRILVSRFFIPVVV